MKDFSIIVAFDRKQGVGRDGVMPWHLPADLRHFRDVTMDAVPGKTNAVIMGRKTWESIPEKFRPLPGRINIVITGQAHYILPSSATRACSFQEALDFCCHPSRDDIGRVFVIGGARVFTEAVHHPACRGLYLTHIDGVFDCDVFFPYIPPCFLELSRSETCNDNGISLYFSFCAKS